MKILVYGAGIQGSFLAHSLINESNEVTLLARGKRKKELLTNGLILNHSIQRKQTKNTVRVIETLQPDDQYDLIFVTMKYSDFPAIIEPLAKNSSSTILFIGNQLEAAALEKELQEKSSQPKRIYFGFQMTGGTNTEKGISVLRFGKGKMKVGSLHTDFAIAQMLDDVFRGTNYAWSYDPKIDDWLKSHAILVMIQNSFEYVYGPSPAKIRKSGDFSAVSIAMRDAYNLLELSGAEVLPKGQRNFFSRPRLTKLFFSIYYRLPISSLVQGSFREIYHLINTFERYQISENSQLDALLQSAKKKYEHSS
ncbi:ketopantoate reductase family protein [Enterococcus malodoratus]|uniref:Ketopantoate reductase N-terminal domain-containing protein n=1 Tax=Enterococcus malodoratus ATCC 43197 TaxID=1158601 RepID=R2RYS5_9ENTE|nr:2-dehydropantoate 2-reductase N-terminal domain-containing protein [Enterococcus malodoratus]EOH81034.1 hypothetical protein UAI_01078 [Enterococcus malodoratus ATCC 43197]EOT69544.1 hypothetical protein I585_01010 [Enterococcus malodoratus ATCC 43197]OJG65275.1 hypothetical protein RV07_GL003037 [Enterococcus malodoratus]SPX01185.1 2-dehydropantoate 2-reductase [Enterococcus malodoratus]STC71102.1 2-dehydropantoate 2-reductase [Enterococcus malodoratus]